MESGADERNSMETLVRQLQEQQWEMRNQLSGLKPIDQIVKYLLYFWLTVSILLGLFGWRQLSNFNRQIDIAVANQFPEHSDEYKNYDALLTKTNILYADFEKLTAEYKERVEDLKLANIVASDFDIEGQINKLFVESNDPMRLYNNEWRTKAIVVLGKFKLAIENKTFPADFIFNAAQLCRQLQQFELAEELTNNAYARDPSPPNTALKLASLAGNKTGKEGEDSYKTLMNMVENLDFESSPEIVLSEAWNAAETTRRYQPLIDSIEKLVANADSANLSAPSYAYTIQAQAILRKSEPGSVERASAVLEKGYGVFKQESPLSQWEQPFRRDYVELINMLAQPREIDVAADEFGSEDMSELFKILEQLELRGDELGLDPSHMISDMKAL